MVHVRRIAIAVASLAGVASCSLLTSLDGLSEPSEGDAGRDALAQVDAAREAGEPGGDASLAPFCATQGDARLCEDFDEAPLPGAFDDTAAVGATTELDSTLSASPQRSLAVTMAPATDTVDRYGGVGKGFALGSPVVVLNTKVHFVKVPKFVDPGPRVDLLTLECGNDVDAPLLSLIVQARPSASGAAEVWLTQYVVTPSAVTYLTAFAATPLHAWRELRVTTDWAASSISLEALDATGKVGLGFAKFTPPPALARPPAFCNYGVGVFSNQAQDGWSVRFDDVVIRTP
jgi:hypothetical protein